MDMQQAAQAVDMAMRAGFLMGCIAGSVGLYVVSSVVAFWRDRR